MAFITDAQLLTELQNVLAQPGTGGVPTQGTFPAYWTVIATRANNAAYWEVVNRLVARGYTLAQVLQWDRGAEFSKDLGLFFCLCSGKAANPEGYSTSFLQLFDRRKELDTVLLTIAGVAQAPLGTFGQVHTGEMDTSGDLFGLDPNDARIGETTEF